MRAGRRAVCYYKSCLVSMPKTKHRGSALHGAPVFHQRVWKKEHHGTASREQEWPSIQSPPHHIDYHHTATMSPVLSSLTWRKLVCHCLVQPKSHPIDVLPHTTDMMKTNTSCWCPNQTQLTDGPKWPHFLKIVNSSGISYARTWRKSAHVLGCSEHAVNEPHGYLRLSAPVSLVSCFCGLLCCGYYISLEDCVVSCR